MSCEKCTELPWETECKVYTVLCTVFEGFYKSKNIKTYSKGYLVKNGKELSYAIDGRCIEHFRSQFGASYKVTHKPTIWPSKSFLWYFPKWHENFFYLYPNGCTDFGRASLQFVPSWKPSKHSLGQWEGKWTKICMVKHRPSLIERGKRLS
jgi:hypothetical protein